MNNSLINSGALKMAINVLRRAGKTEVADELEKCSATVNSLTPEEFNKRTLDKQTLEYNKRPINCGAGNCSCIECLFNEPAFKGLIKR